MASRNSQTLNIILVSLLAGCASQKETISEKNSLYPCDCLIKSFPENARQFVKDGYYEMGNKRIYKMGNVCIEVTKDTKIMKSGNDSIITREYWK